MWRNFPTQPPWIYTHSCFFTSSLQQCLLVIEALNSSQSLLQLSEDLDGPTLQPKATKRPSNQYVTTRKHKEKQLDTQSTPEQLLRSDLGSNLGSDLGSDLGSQSLYDHSLTEEHLSSYKWTHYSCFVTSWSCFVGLESKGWVWWVRDVMSEWLLGMLMVGVISFPKIYGLHGPNRQ